MTEKEIPPQNLPIYLQKYKVYIYPEKEETKVGNVSYTTVGAIPSNEPLARVWVLNLTGVLAPNVEKYRIVYDFSEIEYKDSITFTNAVSGTFNICGRVLDASKIIGKNYTYSDKNRTLTIELDTSKWNFRLKKPTLFSYQLSINDCTAPCESTTEQPPNVQYTFESPYTLTNGNTCTLVYEDVSSEGIPTVELNSPAIVFYNKNGTLELQTDYYYYFYDCSYTWKRINYPTNTGFSSDTGTHAITLGNAAVDCLLGSEYTINYTLERNGSSLVLSIS